MENITSSSTNYTACRITHPPTLSKSSAPWRVFMRFARTPIYDADELLSKALNYPRTQWDSNESKLHFLQDPHLAQAQHRRNPHAARAYPFPLQRWILLPNFGTEQMSTPYHESHLWCSFCPVHIRGRVLLRTLKGPIILTTPSFSFLKRMLGTSLPINSGCSVCSPRSDS